MWRLLSVITLVVASLAPTASGHVALQLRQTQQQPTIATIPNLVPNYDVPQPKSPRAPKPEPKEEAKPAGEHAGQAVACLIFSGVIFSTFLFAMTKTQRPHVANNTVMVIDNIIAIFLAVLWFQGFDDLTKMLPMEHHQLMASALHAMMLVTTAFAIAYAVRNKSTTIAIICGSGAHYCAFASSHVSLSVQGMYFKTHRWECFFGIFAVLGVLMLGGYFLYHVKRSLGINPGVESEDEGHNRFVDRFDDVECDFAAMALAIYFSMVVQFSIMGQYPDPDIDPGAKPDHTDSDRNMMLIYTALLTAIGPVVIEKLSGMSNMGYFKSRMVGLLGSFIAMSIAFGFLTWGKMQFYEHEAVSVSPIVARVWFAATCSLVTMVGIWAVADSMQGRAAATMLTALGLIAGFAWEETFDASVESLVEGTDHEHITKAVIAVVVAALVIPVYAGYVKPVSMKAAEEEGA